MRGFTLTYQELKIPFLVAFRPRFCNNTLRMNVTKKTIVNRDACLVSATPTGQPLGTTRGGENRPQQAQVQGVEIGPTPKGVGTGKLKKTPILTRQRSCRLQTAK